MGGGGVLLPIRSGNQEDGWVSSPSLTSEVWMLVSLSRSSGWRPWPLFYGISIQGYNWYHLIRRTPLTDNTGVLCVNRCVFVGGGGGGSPIRPGHGITTLYEVVGPRGSKSTLQDLHRYLYIDNIFHVYGDPVLGHKGCEHQTSSSAQFYYQPGEVLPCSLSGDDSPRCRHRHFCWGGGG